MTIFYRHWSINIRRMALSYKERESKFFEMLGSSKINTKYLQKMCFGGMYIATVNRDNLFFCMAPYTFSHNYLCVAYKFSANA